MMKKLLLLISCILIVPSLCFGGTARDFDGSTNDVNFGNTTPLQVLGDLTCGAWSNEDVVTGGGRTILAKDKDTGGRAYNLDIETTLSVVKTRFYINGGGGSNIIISTTASASGVWRFWVGTYDDIGASGNLNIYLNGVSNATEITGAAAAIPSATANMLMGQREYASFEDNYDGKLAYGFVEDSVISLTMINEIMWKPEMALANGMFPLWGNSPEQDLSGNGSLGTVSGATAISTTGPPVFFGQGLPL